MLEWVQRFKRKFIHHIYLLHLIMESLSQLTVSVWGSWVMGRMGTVQGQKEQQTTSKGHFKTSHEPDLYVCLCAGWQNTSKTFGKKMQSPQSPTKCHEVQCKWESLTRAAEFKQGPRRCTVDGHTKYAYLFFFCLQEIHISNSCNEHLEIHRSGLRLSTPSL